MKFIIWLKYQVVLIQQFIELTQGWWSNAHIFNSVLEYSQGQYQASDMPHEINKEYVTKVVNSDEKLGMADRKA